MAQLPSQQRVALELVVLRGSSYKAAAAAANVPVGTIMSRLARARENLNFQLQYAA